MPRLSRLSSLTLFALQSVGWHSGPPRCTSYPPERMLSLTQVRNGLLGNSGADGRGHNTVQRRYP